MTLDLLKTAARVCGYKKTGWHEPSKSFWVNDGGPFCWNPLENNEDAFQLAVKAKLPMVHNVCIVPNWDAAERLKIVELSIQKPK